MAATARRSSRRRARRWRPRRERRRRPRRVTRRRPRREWEARWEAQARARARAEDEARGRAEAEARQRARAEAEAKPRAAEPVGARIATVAPGASLVRVPAGNFLMGSAEHDGAGPAHRVTISRAFELQETPVTQAQWKALMGNNPSTYGRDAYPVHNVRWFDAIAYCNALSRALGLEEAYLLTDVNGEPGGEEFSATVKWNGLACLGFRLPTEAEWEYACRAGATGARDGEFDDIAFYGNLAIQPVAKKKPNAWGLRDMLGNVCEWVWDWKADYVSGHQHDPTGPRDPPEDTWRIVRGNTCIENAEEARAAVTLRSAVVPWYQHFALGFRPARSLP